MRQVFRSSIPVDDQWHAIEVGGPILNIATRGEDYIEIWFLNDDATATHSRTFRIFGTGQPGVDGHHGGTAVTPSGQFVWHLFERLAAA